MKIWLILKSGLMIFPHLVTISDLYTAGKVSNGNTRMMGEICSESTRKFYIRRNNNKVDSIEPGPIVIANLLHCTSDLEKCM